MSAPRNTLWGKVRKLGRKIAFLIRGPIQPPLCPRCGDIMKQSHGGWYCKANPDQMMQVQPVRRYEVRQ